MNIRLMQLYSLWSRDMKHILRQPGRVLSYIGQPLLVWIFLGAGFGGSFATSGGMSYSDYLFPGIVLLVSLFSAIFSTMSIIDDRSSGFLQGVLAAPVPRYIIALSKSVVGTTLGFLQAAVFMLFLPFTGIETSAASVLIAMAVLLFVGMTLTSIGFVIAWKVRTSQGFHALMNILLLPLWLLSGAFFPPDGASVWLQWIIRLNPMHYMTTLFTQALYVPDAAAVAAGPGIATAAVVTFGTLLLCTGYSFKVAQS